jgi:tellurite resistance protein TehA-like permease
MVRPSAATDSVAALTPASFAFVMATGIVALAAHQQGLAAVARTLFPLAAVAWVVLWGLTLLRLARHPARVLADLRDHLRGPGFFTAVAGTAVLASGCIALQVSLTAATLLGAFAFLLWVAITYGLFLLLITQAQKPLLHEGISGGWLLAVVACQSISVVCALLSPQMDQPLRLQLNFAALVLWLAGGALYTWLAALLFYRYLFLRFQPADLTPPSWINMGAMAISTLAGTQLVANAVDAPLLQALLPFVQGFTLLYWATGTWWLPLLLALVAWRYLWKRDAPGTGLDWSAVFPLGMYSAATHQLAIVLPLGFLQGLARVFFWLALLAWAATCVARLRRFASGLVRHAGPGAAR